MRDRTIGFFRVLLTITGFVLLVVFGSRAAHDASSMKAAGATDGRQTIATTLGIRLLLGLHNPYAIAPSVGSYLAPRADVSDSTDTAVRPESSVAEAAKPGKATDSLSVRPAPAQPRGSHVLGTRAVQSAAGQTAPASDPSTKVLEVPKRIINDRLDKDVTKSLEPVTNNLPILNHLL